MILTAISLGLRVLALVAVAAVTLLQGSLKQDYAGIEAVTRIRTVPWNSIVQVLIWLIFTGVVLLILRRRPDRNGTIILTVAAAILCAVLGGTLSLVLDNLYLRALSMKGTAELASASALARILSRVLAELNAPALILLLLALGGTCGRDFRTEA